VTTAAPYLVPARIAAAHRAVAALLRQPFPVCAAAAALLPSLRSAVVAPALRPLPFTGPRQTVHVLIDVAADDGGTGLGFRVNPKPNTGESLAQLLEEEGLLAGDELLKEGTVQGRDWTSTAKAWAVRRSFAVSWKMALTCCRDLSSFQCLQQHSFLQSIPPSPPPPPPALRALITQFYASKYAILPLIPHPNTCRPFSDQRIPR